MKNVNHGLDEDSEDWLADYSGEPSGNRPVSRVFVVNLEDAEKRLDVFLAGHFPELSRSRLQKWIAEEVVLVDGKPAKAASLVRPEQKIGVRVPEPEPEVAWVAEPMALEILFEDDEVIVVNKPAQLVVHPAAGHASGTLVNGLLHHCPDLSTVARAGIVHRLDRDTTGLMVVAKTVRAQLSLVKQLHDRSVSREYIALAWGSIDHGETIHAPLGRDNRDRQKMAVLPEGKGKPAITHVKPLAQGIYRGFAVSLVLCRLETGRTHQIRVHLQHIKHPLVGDPVYHKHAPHASRLKPLEKKMAAFDRQALHALRLSFVHPKSGKKVRFESEVPEDLVSLITASGIDIHEIG